MLKDPLFLGGFAQLLRGLRDALHARLHLSGSGGATSGTPHPAAGPRGGGMSPAPPGWALPACPSPAALLSAGPTPPRRRCGSRCPRPRSGFGTGGAPATGRPRRGGSPVQDGFPSPVFLAGIHLPARRRPAAHLHPPRAQPRGGGGERLVGVREAAHSPPVPSLGPPRCSLPRRFGFPAGDAQCSPPPSPSPPSRAAAAEREPVAVRGSGSPPPSPQQRILSRSPLRPPLPPRLRRGYCEVGKKGK